MVRFANFFQMNDWKFKKFIIFVIALQLSFWGIFLLNGIGIEVPLLKQLIGFIYLVFIPGMLFLRIFRLHRLGNIKASLFSVGLSLSFLMFLGFLINSIYPLFGIKEPLSTFNLIITISITTIILCILAYLRDHKFEDVSYIHFKISPVFLLLIFTPFLSIIGTYCVNQYGINTILMVLLVIIPFIIILVMFDKISKDLYPLTVFVISISLLFHTSLISHYIWGCDINFEYYFATLVLKNAYWNPSISSNVNAMLSITILAPTFSKILDMNLIWVFKIVYPFLFSLVPLGLYMVFKEQSNEKIAFLSIFFFMSIFTFYTEMNQLCRQQVAELYFLLLIILMIDSDLNGAKKSILIVLFAFSLVVSHYGLSYIYLLMLLTGILLFYSINKIVEYKGNGSRITTKLKDNFLGQNSILKISFVLLFFVFTLSWYMYVSSSSSFNSIARISNHIINSISTDLLNPEAVQGLSIINAQISSPLHQIPKYLNLLFQFFILIGVFSNLKSIKKFKSSYVIFSFVSLFILALSVVLPYFASSLNMTRIYHITLFFLSPFAIIGAIYSLKFISKLFKISWTKKQFNLSLKIISVLLIILFLFYTGFIYEITGDNPTSFAISNSADGGYPFFTCQDVESAKWLYNYGNKDYIYADWYKYHLIADFEPQKKILTLNENFEKINGSSYIFLGSSNLLNETLLIVHTVNSSKKQVYVSFGNLTEDRTNIYNNGGSLILT